MLHFRFETALFQGADMEVLLMNWGPQRASLPHDHGQSEGWVKVIQGTATHGYYKAAEGTIPALSHEEHVACGEVMYVPMNMVHHMANAGEGPLVTFHVYFPSINDMEVFDLKGSCAAVVSPDCGAWWPQSDLQMIRYRALA